MAEDAKRKCSKGAMAAAMEIDSQDTGVRWKSERALRYAEIISRETRDQEMPELLREVHAALTSVLDSLGALTNPSELDGLGLSADEQTAILAAHERGKLLLAGIEAQQ